MNFFLDHNMPRGLAKAVQALVAPVQDHAFRHHRDEWETDPGDPIWIPEVAKWDGDWKLISGDRKILTTPQNKEALRESGLVGFFMTKNFARHSKWVQASLFFKAFPDIEKAALKATRGDLFNVTENGKIEQIQKV